MKRSFYLASLTLLLIMLSYHLCAGQKVSGPQIKLEEKSFDAKEVREDAVIEHAFKVLNTGDKPLEINKVSAG